LAYSDVQLRQRNGYAVHKLKTRISLFVVLFSQFPTQATTANDAIVIEANIRAKVQVVGKTYQAFSITERMKHYKVPGLSIAVVNNGKLAWAKGYGIANKHTKQVVNENTLFQAGSISKPIAALAALKLVQEKKVLLDTDVNQYLSRWKVPQSKYTEQQPVTLRQLLTHTAGITVHGFPGYQQGKELPSNVEVLTGKGNTAKVFVDQLPGSHWRYSGGGYTVMEQLVEDVTKLPFDEYLQKEILEPLNMSHSSFEQPLSKSKWPFASAAFDNNGEQIEGDWHNYPEQAAAGLWTTPSDLAQYILAIQKSRSGDNKQLLNKTTVDQMLTIHKGDWGLGPILSEHEKGLIFVHGGKNAGFTNNFSAYVDRGDGLVIMANGDNAGPLIAELKVAISSHYHWDLADIIMLTPVKISEEISTAIAGEYRYDADPDYLISLSVTDDHIALYIHENEEKQLFIPTSNEVITNLTSGSKISFKKDEQGKTTGLTWSDSYQFTKIAK